MKKTIDVLSDKDLMKQIKEGKKKGTKVIHAVGIDNPGYHLPVRYLVEIADVQQFGLLFEFFYEL